MLHECFQPIVSDCGGAAAVQLQSRDVKTHRVRTLPERRQARSTRALACNLSLNISSGCVCYDSTSYTAVPACSEQRTAQAGELVHAAGVEREVV